MCILQHFFFLAGVNAPGDGDVYTARTDRLMTQPTDILVLELETTTQPVDFRTLVEAHKRTVYYLALDLTGSHHDAEDLAQEVFIKAYRALGQFRGEAAVQTWLRRIAINTYLNKRRKKALTFMRFFGDFGEAQWAQDDLVHPDREVAGQVARQHIEDALEQLSPRERSAFVLRFYQELSIREVAESMACAEGTVKSLLHRAVKKLQKALSFYRTELGLEERP